MVMTFYRAHRGNPAPFRVGLLAIKSQQRAGASLGTTRKPAETVTKFSGLSNNLLQRHCGTNLQLPVFTGPKTDHVRFQINISQISFQLLPISPTTVGSKPQCIMHWAQRGSLPTPYLSQSVFSIISLKLG